MGVVLKPVSKISGTFGQAGEEKVSQYLAQELPDEYLILNSPRIYHAGETVDIDHIILGPRGIFVVESKNMLGKVTGGLMGNWVQTKTKFGQTEQIKIGNPANQANHYAKVVRDFLSLQYEKKYNVKLNIRVLPVVVFAHDQADLSEIVYTKEGMVGRVRILSVEEMKEYVLTKRKLTYSPQLVEKLAEIVIPLDQRDQTGIFHSLIMPSYRETFSDRYELKEEIGRGNFGVVYKGHDKKLDRDVAIKKLHPSQQQDKDVVERFMREATISTKLHHENIVTVYDFYEEEGQFYLVMEYLPSKTLDNYLAEYKPDFTEIARIMDEICQGLANAHDNQVVHRDLKPANILVSENGKVKISDFGIARLVGAPMLTQTQTSLGTPYAMSPEQIMGKEVDARSDIFALGVLLYSMVTGQLPFSGDNIGEIVFKVLQENPQPPSKFNTEMSPALEKVIFKALEKDPSNRYQTVEELRIDLINSLDPNNVSNILLSGDPFRKKAGKILKRIVKETIFDPEKRFKFFGAVTALFIIGAIFTQLYVDSRELVNDPNTPVVVRPSEQDTFTNDNIEYLNSNPAKYKGSKVDFTGRVDLILNKVQNQYLFSVTIDNPGSVKVNHIIVVYKGADPNLNLQPQDFIHIKGLVKDKLANPVSQTDEPLINAKTVEIVPAWQVLYPAIKTLNVNKSLDHEGRKVTLKKVEIAETETRLFLEITNSTSEPQPLSLNDSVAIQGRRIAKLNYYRNSQELQFMLPPQETFKTILVLEKISSNAGSASFSVGTKFVGNLPYVFDVKW